MAVSVRRLARGLLEAEPAPHHIDLRLGGCAIRVRTNSPDLLDELRDYFGPIVRPADRTPIVVTALDATAPQPDLPFEIKAPDPGKTKIKEEYVDTPDGRVVRKRLTGMLFFFGGELNVVIGPALKNSNQVVNFINNRYIQWLLRQGCILGHAAAVSTDRSGLAIAGFSGAGKSTLALHLVSEGLDFVSNDRLLVRKRGDGLLMHGVPKHPRINPGTVLSIDALEGVLTDEARRRTNGLSTDELWKLEHKHDVIIHDTFGAERFRLDAPMDALVILNWERSSAPLEMSRVELDQRRDLLPAFIKSPGLFYEPGDADVDLSGDAYVDHLSRTRVYELTGGVDFAQASAVCQQVLAETDAAKGERAPWPPSRTWRTRVTRTVAIPDGRRLERFRRAPELGPSVLFFSGGTALNPLARSITAYTHNSIHLVTPFDSGGSSASLREAFGMLSVGDMRSRLMALADQSMSGEPEIRRLFAYRLPRSAGPAPLRAALDAMVRGAHPLVAHVPDPMRKIVRNHLRLFAEAMPETFDLRGASVGNLMLVGGYLNNARHVDPVIFTFSKLVQARGTVRTITGENLHIAARLKSGATVCGQRNLTGKEVDPIRSPIEEVYLTDGSEGARRTTLAIREKVRALIGQAELICYPMGSFYSSVVVNLLPEGVGEAIAGNPCLKVYVPNTGTDPEELGMSKADCVRTLLRYASEDVDEPGPASSLLNYVIVDTRSDAYSAPLDLSAIRKTGPEVIDVELVTPESEPSINPERLCAVLLSLC